MKWLNTPDERRCGTCGVIVEHWVLHRNEGHQVAEATFCPVCYPDLKSVFGTPEAIGAASVGRLQSASFIETDEIPGYPFLFPENWSRQIVS